MRPLIAPEVEPPPPGAEFLDPDECVIRVRDLDEVPAGYYVAHWSRGRFTAYPHQVVRGGKRYQLVLFRSRASDAARAMGWPVRWVGQCTYATYVVH